MATKLILIRHGSTEWNLEKRYCGSLDSKLNDRGRIQVIKLRKRLVDEDIHRVYCSDRMRAIQSAETIFKGLKIKRVPDLREIDFGIFEGLSHKEILKKYSCIYKKWLKDPLGIAIPYGEDIKDFRKRVLRAFKNIIRLNKNKTVAVVCHGGPISMFINHILKSKGFWKQIPSSASLSIVEYKNCKARIRVFNDTTHLNE